MFPLLSATCRFQGSILTIRLSGSPTIRVGDVLRLTKDGTAPRVFSLDFPGIQFAEGNATVQAPTESVFPDAVINIAPGERVIRNDSICIFLFK